MDTIEVRGARTHNLKNIDLDIPRDKLVVITGLSGVRQVIPRLRYALCRGTAPLCGVSVDLREAVSVDDGKAGHRPYRRLVARHLDRAEIDLA
jgi:hypothetical protein